MSLTPCVCMLFLHLGLALATNNATTNSTSVHIVDADHLMDSGEDAEVEEIFGFARKINASSGGNVLSTTTPPDNEASSTLAVDSPATTTTTTTTSTTTSTTTTSKPTTVTTATTKKPVTKIPKPANRRVCGCDLHINSCDMNCCCDVDCSDEEKQVFSYCLDSEFYEPKVTSPTSHSCFRTDIFYRENSPYFVRQTNKGMFCVVMENIDRTEELPAEPSNIDLNYLMQKRPKFSWKAFEQAHPEIPRAPYRYGSVLMKVVGNPSGTLEAGPFYIPASLYGSSCSAMDSAKFLKPNSHKCMRVVGDLEGKCNGNSELSANYFIKNTAFVSNPGMENLTESLVPIIFAICTKDTGRKMCSPCSPLNDPVWDKPSRTCLNVLEDLELSFIHAGARGLLKVIAKATFTNVDGNSTIILQKFSTNYAWGEFSDSDEDSLNATESRPVENQDQLVTESMHYPRSGNPGYILGKPVLMGPKVIRVMEKNLTEHKSESKEESFEADPGETDEEKRRDGRTERVGISLDQDPGGWMTIHKPGRCSHEQRNNVYFGIAHQTECSLNVSEAATCDDLQEIVTTTILGMHPSNFTDLYVSAFGNPDVDDLSEWTPVLVSGLPAALGKEGSLSPKHGCDGIVSTMKIKIAFAYVGCVRFPQAKIVGVLYEFGDSYSVPKKLRCQKDDEECQKYDHLISVTTTVLFLDVTKAPIPRVGQWPVVSIKLPHDFFYPFSATSSSNICCVSLLDIIIPLFLSHCTLL